jgi:hypothetical protein
MIVIAIAMLLVLTVKEAVDKWYQCAVLLFEGTIEKCDSMILNRLIES